MGPVWLWIVIGALVVLSAVSVMTNRYAGGPATSTRNKKRGWCCQKEFD